jgi:hypothetical protein
MRGPLRFALSVGCASLVVATGCGTKGSQNQRGRSAKNFGPAGSEAASGDATGAFPKATPTAAPTPIVIGGGSSSGDGAAGADAGGGSGTGTTTANPGPAKGTPVSIRSVADLKGIANDSQGTFLLEQDLDLTGVDWRPLVFNGVFDGQGHTISNYTFTAPVDYRDSDVGFFSVIGSAGTVKNLNLTGLNSAGLQSGEWSSAGGLVYTNQGTIENCSVSGAIPPPLGDRGFNYVGGFALANTGTIRNSRADVAISHGGYAGVFTESNDGTITRSSARGSIDSVNYAGGMVTFNRGTISASMANVAITNSTFAGGFAMSNASVIEDAYILGSSALFATMNKGGTIRRCFSADGAASGIVNGDERYIDKVESCFFDSGGTPSYSGAGGTGVDAAALRTQATFVGWDFNAVWLPPKDGGYPTLR